MLHTVVPQEMIFRADDNGYEEERADGATLVWRVNPNGARSLCRVISTDLRDFLKYTV